ncbi:MAG: membrane protein insertase YidC [Thermodesulfobacteriota bacterium]
MEKRALLAVIISLIILIIYQQYFAPPPPEVPKDKAEKKAPMEKAAPVEEKKMALPIAKPAPAKEEIKVQPGKNVTVETPLYTATFDTRGARLKSWQVKKYMDKIGEGAKPIDLATQALSDGYPLGLEIREANFSFSPEAIFKANKETLNLGPSQPKGDLIFTWESPEGLIISLIITLYADSYRMDMNINLLNHSANQYEGRPTLYWAGKVPSAAGGGGFACVPKSGNGAGTTVPPFTTLIKKELHEVEFSDLKDEKRFYQNVQWVGFQNVYFLAAFIPQRSEGIEVIMKKNSDTSADLRLSGPKIVLPPQTKHSQVYAIYLGPKDLDVLKSFGADLDRALDFGWFDIVAKPILYLMKYFYSYTGNYGLAIIILTVIIKIIFWYPTHISYKSMKEMKKIQPEMAKLREKYPHDREKLNKELMELYRRYKINPMSGCLPIAIQIPIFFALYKVLLYSIEIRHAPFYWWIKDLSAHDPYYISPILMGVSMFIQQWMTPSPGDPTQAKMMLIMPVIFTFMFLTFPTGLVIYWLFNNLLSIGQQIYINKNSK